MIGKGGQEVEAHVERLSAELAERYKLYIGTFMLDICDADGAIELRVGYALRSDHEPRLAVFTDERLKSSDPLEAGAVIAALFADIEGHIVEAIAAQEQALN